MAIGKWILGRGKTIETDQNGYPERIAGIHTDITDEKKLEMSLRESEETYRNIVANCNEGIVLINQDGIVCEWNSALERITGIHKTESIGNHIIEIHDRLLTPERKTLVNQKWLYLSIDELIEQITSSSSRIKTETICSVDGSIIDLHISFFTFTINSHKMVGSIVRDITQQNRMQSTLQQYRMAVEESEELIIAVDLDYRLIFANKSYLRYWNYTSDQIIGKQLYEIVGDEVFYKYIKPHLDLCFHGNLAHTLFLRNYPILGERWMDSDYFPLREPDGKITGAVTMIRDCTEQKRAEREQTILLEQLHEAIADGMVTLDDKGIILKLNESAERLLSIHKEDVIAKELNLVIPPEYKLVADSLLDSICQDEFVREKEVEGVSPNGVCWTYNLNITPLRTGITNLSILIIRDITRLRQLEQEITKKNPCGGIIGKSVVMNKIFDLIRNLADLPTTVLIEGESGTGKELAASALHEIGCRCSQPFIRVNCAALPESLLETELFGHVRGCFYRSHPKQTRAV